MDIWKEIKSAFDADEIVCLSDMDEDLRVVKALRSAGHRADYEPGMWRVYP